jgi:hypothetical protein
MSHEVPARRTKKESLAGLPEDQQNQQTAEVEMTIWLKDFPQSLADYKAVLALKQSIHGAFLLEEKFVPEDLDDYSLKPTTNDLNMSPSNFEIQLEEERKRAEERAKVEFSQTERLVALHAALELPKLTQAVPDLQFTIQRLKFKGGDPPMQVSASSPEDGSGEALASSADQEKVKEEEVGIASFVDGLHSQIELASREVQEYRLVKKTFKPPKPLWPYSDDDPEVIKQREEAERRKKEEEILRK